MWSLPKGHLEAGETAEQAAIREVQEETGIRGRILAPLGAIDFWFVADGRRIHKTVHHFLLESTGGQISDDDPEVVEVEWVNLEDIRGRLAYPDERRLLDQVPRLLAGV
ncbi:MAG: 8-oxo-dGTP pyrophosphatase MutT (NUDIX family), partial [Actinomycetes bacterium]